MKFINASPFEKGFTTIEVETELNWLARFFGFKPERRKYYGFSNHWNQIPGFKMPGFIVQAELYSMYECASRWYRPGLMPWHVYPVNDEREHEMESSVCWCNPEIKWKDENGDIFSDGPLIVHNSADCREVVEEAERIKAEAS